MAVVRYSACIGIQIGIHRQRLLSYIVPEPEIDGAEVAAGTCDELSSDFC